MADKVSKSSFLTWLGLDPLTPTRDHVGKEYRYTGSDRSWLIPAAIGIAFLVLSVVGWVVDPPQFYLSYLIAWTFCLSIAIGSLFFVVIQHLTKAKWSVVVRRIPEALSWSFPLLAILGIPIIFGMYDLYHWTHEELFIEGHPGYDEIVAGKEPYLNEPFFFIRMAIYFTVWTILSYKLYTISVRNDADPSRDTPANLRFHSAWGLPALAVTTAFASFDILMSLEPHWFSTIYPIYFFGASFFATLAAITLCSLVLQKRGGMLRNTITLEHYHDLGKLMFGFTVFWAYIFFSQYMLIWYAGIPEETMFYRHRLEHGWEVHTYALILVHFVIPFIVLLPRFTKRMTSVLAFFSVWFLVVHWVDLHWLAAPNVRPEEAGFHWLDFTTLLGLGGVFVAIFIYRLKRHALVPEKDPYLKRSLEFENV